MMWLERSFATDRRLQKVRCPALVFHGDDDTIIPIAHGKKVADGIASLRNEFVRVAGGTHNNFQYVMGFENYVEKIVRFCMTITQGADNGHN